MAATAYGTPNRAASYGLGSKPAVCQPMVSSQRGPRQTQGHNNGFLGFLWASKALKPLKPLKPLKLLKLCHSVWDAQSRSLKPLKLCPSVWDAQPRRHKLPQGQIHHFFSARSTPTGTPRPQQWLLRLLMGVQACRLPALKPLKPLKPLKLLKLCHSVWDAQPRSLKPLKPQQWLLSKRLGCQAPQGHNNGFLGFLWASKPAVCQPLNP